jgi:type VI secretion system protein ImpH
VAAARGPAADPVSTLEELRSQPEAFSLFAAVRALEAIHVDRPRIGEAPRAAAEQFRFSQSPHLEFAPSEIRSLTEQRAWRLEQYVFGVFGPNGALPLHLTELAAERARHFDDPTIRDFVNLFQHRLTSLFYRAWAESEPVAQADRPADDRFRLGLAALTGLDSPAAMRRDKVDDGAKLARAGLFASCARSVDALETLLSDYFVLDVRVRSYVPRWLDIPGDALLRLGGPRDAATLGQGATLGGSTWQANQSFEIVIGPVDLVVLNWLLPGSPALEELRDLVRLFTNDEWQWQLRILVRRESVHGVKLGADARLGWTSWLGSRQEVADEVVIQGDRPRVA